MRRLVLSIVLALGLAAAAAAQIVEKSPVASGAVSPETMTARVQQAVMRYRGQGVGGADRFASYDYAWPKDMAELQAVGGYIIVLATVVTHDVKELPLKRAYISGTSGDIELMPLGSIRRDPPAGSDIAAFFGAYREDDFFAAPADAMGRPGQLRIDFAASRTGFVLSQLPDRLPASLAGQHLPPPASRPEPVAFAALFAREYVGFGVQPRVN